MVIFKTNKHSTAGHPDVGKILRNGIETQNTIFLVAAGKSMGEGVGDDESNISRNTNRKLSLPVHGR